MHAFNFRACDVWYCRVDREQKARGLPLPATQRLIKLLTTHSVQLTQSQRHPTTHVSLLLRYVLSQLTQQRLTIRRPTHTPHLTQHTTITHARRRLTTRPLLTTLTHCSRISPTHKSRPTHTQEEIIHPPWSIHAHCSRTVLTHTTNLPTHTPIERIHPL